MQDILNAVPRRAVLAAGIGLIAVLVVATAVVVTLLRYDALERAEAHLTNLATVLGEQTRQTVQSIELVVKTTAEELKQREAGKLPLSDRELFEHMQARVAIIPDVRVLTVTDGGGRAVLHSSAFPAPDVSYRDREYFSAHLDRRIEVLHVGKPVVGRLLPERLNAFSYRVEDEGGRFRGIVAAGVRESHFQSLFGPLALGPGGQSALLRADGIVLTTYPVRENAFGQSLAQDALFRDPSASPKAYRRPGLFESEPRVLAAARVKGYPLVVIVSSTESHILSEWRRDAWRIGGGAAGAAVFMGIALLFLLRQTSVSAGLRHDLDDAAARMHGVIQSAMDAIITVDESEKILLFNAAAERIFACPAAEALGGPLARFIPERFRAAHHGHIKRFGETGTTTRMMGARLELYGLRATGQEFSVDASISQVTVGGHKLYTVILRDVSEQRQAEAALQQSYRERHSVSERLHGIIQSAMDAIITIDSEQRIVGFNEAAETIFRCPAEQAIGGSLERFIPQRFRSAHRTHVERFAETRITTRVMGARLELFGLRADGEEFPIDASISQVTVDEGRFYTVILRDVSRRMAAERALRHSYEELREMSAVMHQVREGERTRIARELHDELAQWLTAIRMDVSWLSSRLPPEQEQLTRRTDKMKQLVDTTVAAVRRIAADLRPVMLDDLGLISSIEHLVLEFSERSNIAVSLDLHAGEADFHDPLATAVYRMVQEALTNIARHAGATEVTVAVTLDGDALCVRVSDNGRGLPPQPGERKSYGILGIRERAQTLGGRAEIYSPPEGGTVVEIAIPAGRFRRREEAA